jgi:uncharacterized membrane protein YfcA
MDLLVTSALVVTAAAGGFVDTIAGGGGLLVLPALLAAGLPPQAALATSKLQASVGIVTASVTFLRRGEVRLQEVWPGIVGSFVGGTIGALAIERMNADFLRQIIPVLLIAIAIYMLFAKRVLEREASIDHPALLGPLVFGLVLGLGLGFYDGFFGPGTGSFWAIAHVALRGFDLRRATVHTKLVNAASNIAALLAFIAGGSVVWGLGLAMAVGQFAGARLGAHLVLGRGSALIRPMLVIMSLAITARILATDPDNFLRVGAVHAARAVGKLIP